jgi:hypothetical protein
MRRRLHKQKMRCRKESFFEEVKRAIDESYAEGENEMLEREFSKEEVKRPIDESYAKGASGPDGFSFLFYQKFWRIVKKI